MGLILCIVVMSAALLLGGGTRSGFLGDVVLQLAAIPLLVFAIVRMTETPRERRRPWTWMALVAIALVPLLQLVPLPDAFWSTLPNRDLVREAFELAGVPRPALPLSVTPSDTWLAAVSLLPPAALFLGTLLLGYEQRRKLTLVVIAIGAASMVLGLLQVGQGRGSPLRFFEFASFDDAIGFFANRNHFAAFNYSLTVLLGAWMVYLVSGSQALGRSKSKDTNLTLYVLLGLTAFVMQIATQALTRSRTGLALMVVALGIVIALSWRFRTERDLAARSDDDRDKEHGRGGTRILIVASVLAVGLVVQYALFVVLERFAGLDPLKDGRVAIGKNSIEAAKSFMPWGAGMGSFTSVYPIFEKTSDLMVDTYANRAHNDFLEVWMEAGVAGLAAISMFLIWLAVSSVGVWRSPAPGHASTRGQPIDRTLARAASAILVLLCIHSLLDYPLRTGALMAVFAFCCAMLVPPILRTQAEDLAALPAEEAKPERRKSSREPLQPVSIGAGVLAPAPQSRADWRSPDAAEEPPAQPGEGGHGRTNWPADARGHDVPASDPPVPRDGVAEPVIGWPEATSPGDRGIATAADPKPADKGTGGPAAEWPRDWVQQAPAKPRVAPTEPAPRLPADWTPKK